MGFRFPANVRRRYERLRRFPDGLLVLGDALCSFNPIYGQGMTVAALQALALRDQRHPPGVRPTHPQRPTARSRARPTCPGNSPWAPTSPCPGSTALARRAGASPARTSARLQAAAAHDPQLSRAFVRVTGLIDPPGRLLRPATALRVWHPRTSTFAGSPGARGLDA